jgi:GNAT superfamily N-acetyltransferase
MPIRTTTATDAEAVRALVVRAYSPYIPRIGRRPAPMDHDYVEKVRLRGAYVAVAADRITGLIVLVPEPDTLLIENVAVDPDRQGEGIGRALMAHAEEFARAAGLSTLRLYTHAAMTENLELYPHLGYRETERRREDGFERVFFAKRLS